MRVDFVPGCARRKSFLRRAFLPDFLLRAEGPQLVPDLNGRRERKAPAEADKRFGHDAKAFAKPSFHLERSGSAP